MEFAILFRLVVYFRFLLAGCLVYPLLRRFSPNFAKVAWSLAVAMQFIAIVIDLLP